jgi:hypothetical protein
MEFWTNGNKFGSIKPEFVTRAVEPGEGGARNLLTGRTEEEGALTA